MPAHIPPAPHPATPHAPAQSKDNPPPPTPNASTQSVLPNPATRKNKCLAAPPAIPPETAPHDHPAPRRVPQPPPRSAGLSCHSENRKKSQSNSTPHPRTQ